MRSLVLEAKSVAVAHPDGGIHLIGFADSEFNTSTYLVLQRSLEFDEQDSALGMDTPITSSGAAKRAPVMVESLDSSCVQATLR